MAPKKPAKKPVTRRPPPYLITLQEAARLTGVPYTSIRKLVFDGHIPRVQLGDSVRTWIKRDDLDRLIANSTEPATR